MISRELGFTSLEKCQEEKLRYVSKNQKEVQRYVNLAIRETLNQKCNSPDELERLLMEKGITCKFMLEDGKMKSSSYSYEGVAIKGQDVGFTARKLQRMLEKSVSRKLDINLGIK